MRGKLIIQTKFYKKHFKQVNAQLISIFMLGYALFLLAIGLFFATPREIIQGSGVIFNSPSHLLTDYIALTNFGSAFFNSGLLTLLSLLLALKVNVPMDNKFIAAIFSVSGFSFFGKNIFNTLPILIGIWLYAKASQQPLKKHVNTALFGSSISPVISYLAFGLALPQGLGIFLGTLVGILIGFFLPILSLHFFNFHKGYNLYNVGFTSGIISMFVMGILTILGIEVTPTNLLSENQQGAILGFLIFLCSFMIIIGLIFFWIEAREIRKFNHLSMVKEDIRISVSSINMGLLGFFMIAYILLVGGSFNGPILGSLLTIIGFAPMGIHVNKAWPILFGAFLAEFVGVVDLSGSSGIMAALFALGLTPLSRQFGPFAGMIAGMFHISIVGNIFFLHGGLNLYNNGFTCGFVAAFLLPIFEYLNGLTFMKKIRLKRPRLSFTKLKTYFSVFMKNELPDSLEDEG